MTDSLTPPVNWKAPIEAAVARVQDPRRRAELAQLLATAAEVALQAGAGLPQSQRDLEILKGSILHAVAEDAQELAAAVEESARLRMRQAIWGLFGLLVA